MQIRRKHSKTLDLRKPTHKLVESSQRKRFTKRRRRPFRIPRFSLPKVQLGSWQKILVVSMLFLGVLFFVFRFFSFFGLNVSNVTIESDLPLYDHDLLRKEIELFAGTNIFTLGEEEVAEVIQDVYPYVDEVKTQYILPNGLRISIGSYVPIAQFFEDDQLFWLYQNGRISPALDERENLPTILFDLQDKEELYHGFIQPFTQLHEYMINAFPDTSLSYIWYQESGDIIVNIGGTFIILSFMYIEGLGNGEKVDVSLEDLVYVDLRVPEMVYTCAKSELYCYSNLYALYPGIEFRP